MPKISINGNEFEVPAGSTILDAARTVGIRIPTLCHLEGHEALGACRVCVVDVEGAKTTMPACVTPVNDGMRVHTNSARARAARKTVVELLLSEHDGDCRYCGRADDCELKQLAWELGVRE
ncbi:MAG: 2Fe-2S iron-sulfur cluster-binding protein, partial [Spirochaetaceae bacterium]